MGTCKICGKEALSGFVVHSECLNNLNITPCTKNHTDHRKAMSELSVASILKAHNYICLLSQFISHENEVLDDFENVIKPLGELFKKLLTNEPCPHSDCDRLLYKSDLPQYDYVCPDCDENF